MAGGPVPTAGYKSICAFAIENSIAGIARVLGSGDAIHAVEVQVVEEPITVENQFVFFKGKRLAGNSQKGSLLIEGHYGEISLLAVALGGSDGAKSPISLGSGAYQHFFEPDWNLADRDVSLWESNIPSGKFRRRGTLGLERGGNLWILDGCFFESLKINSNAGGKVWIELDFVSRSKVLNSVDQSSATWTFPIASLISFDALKIWVWGRDKFTLSGGKTITWSNSTGSSSATLNNQTYYALELADEIAAKMTAQNIGSELYKAGYDHNTRRFWIASDTPFQITGSGTVNSIIGFSASASRKLRQESDFAAVPNDIPYYSDSTDLINVSQFSFVHNNDLVWDQFLDRNFHPAAIKITPSKSGGIIISPYYVVGGNNVTIYDHMREGEPFCMKAEFTGALIGGGYYEKLTLLFPTVTFRNNIPLANGAIRPEVSFDVHLPGRLDMRNMAQSAYRFGSIYKGGAEVLISAGVYKDELIVGSDALKVYRIKDNEKTFEQIGSPDSDPISFKSWNSYLSVGCFDGETYRWNGSSFTAGTVLASGVIDLEFYEGKIYALLTNGDVYSSIDGLSWSLSYDGSATGFRLLSAFGKLFALIAGDIRQFDGSSWSLAYDFANTPSNMSICFMGGAVYATSDAKIAKNTGTGFANLGTLGITPKHIEGYLGNIIILESGTTKDIYYLNEAGAAAVVIDNTFNQTFQYRPVIICNRLVIPVTAAGLLRFFKAREFLVSVINRTSTNPLF
ncbi:MAG: hypothetical protein ONB55_21735 [candidate division KSB1 bacterium]|nr:hypothetical protein [candidate division KSB1 bacterium]